MTTPLQSSDRVANIQVDFLADILEIELHIIERTIGGGFIPQFQDLHFSLQPALLETSGWLALEPMPTRAVWRYAAMECGELYVMTPGVVWMQV